MTDNIVNRFVRMQCNSKLKTYLNGHLKATTDDVNLIIKSYDNLKLKEMRKLRVDLKNQFEDLNEILMR